MFDVSLMCTSQCCIWANICQLRMTPCFEAAECSRLGSQLSSPRWIRRESQAHNGTADSSKTRSSNICHNLIDLAQLNETLDHLLVNLSTQVDGESKPQGETWQKKSCVEAGAGRVSGFGWWKLGEGSDSQYETKSVAGMRPLQLLKTQDARRIPLYNELTTNIVTSRSKWNFQTIGLQGALSPEVVQCHPTLRCIPICLPWATSQWVRVGLKTGISEA